MVSMTSPSEAGQGSRRTAPVGHAAMRSANLSLLLRHLHAHGGRSRATLAQETGLSKASVTSLVSDLVERGLVQEGSVERRGAVGRPGTEVRLAPQHVAGIGLELNVDYLAVCMRDLAGQVRFTDSVPMPYALDPAASDGRFYPLAPILDLAAEQLQRALTAAAAQGLWVAAATIAPPGPIDYDEARVRFASNLGWADVPLGEELGRRLGEGHPMLTLENDAKLSALAEAPRLARRGITDLVYLTGDMGVGAGIIAEGRLIRGWSGFSGEVGHIGLDPAGEWCRCGRRGCWETMVGFDTVLDALDEDDPARSGRLPMLERLALIRALLEAGHAPLQERFTRLAGDLVRGAGVLVDVLNPQAIVLGGYFGHFADLLVAPVQAALDERLLAPDGRVEVSASSLGLEAAAAGGAAVALDRVLDDPLLAPVLRG